MITRIAPTPSGFLHLGNAVDFRLVYGLARTNDGAIALRIDDMDATLARAEYVDYVFDVLTWLDIDWTIGPRDRADFEANHAQSRRTDYFRAELDAAVDRGLAVYVCTCSRSMQKGVPTGGCVGRCWERVMPLEPGTAALRVRVPRGTVIDVGDRVVHLDERMGDFVVWRRDDLPAYQLASVVLDRDLGVTHVVRGIDLIDSTAAQVFLAPFLDATPFADATFLHHQLVTGPDDAKLSKSRHAPAIDRSPTSRQLVDYLAARLGEPLGIGVS